MECPAFFSFFGGYVEPPKQHEVQTPDSPKQKILHNLQQRSLYRIQQLTTATLYDNVHVSQRQIQIFP